MGNVSKILIKNKTMKHFFLKQIQAFISHKRINGQASPEAILVKNALDTDATSMHRGLEPTALRHPRL